MRTLTVGELIAELQKLNPYLPVDGNPGFIVGVQVVKNHNSRTDDTQETVPELAWAVLDRRP